MYTASGQVRSSFGEGSLCEPSSLGGRGGGNKLQGLQAQGMLPDAAPKKMLKLACQDTLPSIGSCTDELMPALELKAPVLCFSAT